MTRLRYIEGLPMGRMVADTSGIQRYTPAAAACAKCGARLSRYRLFTETKCAPCQLAAGEVEEPPDPAAEQASRTGPKAKGPPRNRLTRDQKLASSAYDACACGEPKRKDKPRCRGCTNELARVPGARWSKRCACGAVKAKGAHKCMVCRYGIAAA